MAGGACHHRDGDQGERRHKRQLHAGEEMYPCHGRDVGVEADDQQAARDRYRRGKEQPRECCSDQLTGAHSEPDCAPGVQRGERAQGGKYGSHCNAAKLYERPGGKHADDESSARGRGKHCPGGHRRKRRHPAQQKHESGGQAEGDQRAGPPRGPSRLPGERRGSANRGALGHQGVCEPSDVPNVVSHRVRMGSHHQTHVAGADVPFAHGTGIPGHGHLRDHPEQV